MSDFFILDVGHGNSAVLIDKQGVLVIDTGSSSTLLEFLISKNINTIDTLLISHADVDHLSGLTGVLSSGVVKINDIYLNADSSKDTDTWNDILTTLRDLRRTGINTNLHIELTTTTKAFFPGSVTVEILGPMAEIAAKGAGSNDLQGRKLNSNSLSAVVKLTDKQHSICLIPGDLDQIGLTNLIEDKKDIKALVLIFPHHGGRTGESEDSFVDALIDKVKPELVVFSLGRDKYQNPRPEIVKRIREKNPHVKFACTQISKHCSFKRELGGITHLLSEVSRGKEDAKCCAGTLQVFMENNLLKVLPERGAHKRFIRENAETPLCL